MYETGQNYVGRLRRKQLEKSVQKQLDLRQWLQERKDLSATERLVLTWTKPQQSVEFWVAKCEKAESGLKEDRKYGWRNWANKYQTFGAGVMGLLRDWEPIIDVVKRSGGPYGELFFGTVSILFIVAEVKSVSEGYLSAALMEIKDAMLGFALYGEIFSQSDALEKDLQEKMVEAYTAFVTMAVDATKYFKASGKGRCFKAMRECRRFEEQTENIKTSIARIRLRCNDLMSRNIDDIKRSNECLMVELNRLHRRFDEEKLASITRVWEVPYQSPTERTRLLDLYRNELQSAFSDDVEHFYSIGDRKRAEFERSESFTTWEATTKSAFLVLVGFPEYSVVEQQQHCWISPIAIDFINDCKASTKYHAYHILPSKGRTSLKTIMLSLLSQILPLQCEKFRDSTTCRNIEESYAKIARSHDRCDMKALDESLGSLGLHILELFSPSDSITVILDRVDRCEEDDRVALLRILAQLAQAVKCTFKVFVVIRGSDWSFQPAGSTRVRRPCRNV
ncbi:hypothetical protein CC80DRAFT_579665 [Byssothecium circinans]|uniref:DUF7708 domain-containing protein n=1 Tax=Byssothecium circinans TaxID=147558 RepID=A0A6A5TBX9_9PLEO|nr:hypothetical protein CC80DRAFT_579665 [Byssothecium circinans]